jgi:hypothetical protein
MNEILRACEGIESATYGQQYVVWNSFHTPHISCGMNSTLHSFTTFEMGFFAGREAMMLEIPGILDRHRRNPLR